MSRSAASASKAPRPSAPPGNRRGIPTNARNRRIDSPSVSAQTAQTTTTDPPVLSHNSASDPRC